MCVIAFMPPEKMITKDNFAESVRCNKDGIGILYNNPEDGRLYFWKSITGRETGWDILTEIREKHPSAKIGFHARIATHGSVTKENCHPFFTADIQVGMMHNGIIRLPNLPLGKSDSEFFAETILSKLPTGFINNQAATTILDDFVRRSSSKVLAIDAQGNHAIYGESLGHWNEGVWWSNRSYEIWVPVSRTCRNDDFPWSPPYSRKEGETKYLTGRKTPHETSTKKPEATKYECAKCNIGDMVHPKKRYVKIDDTPHTVHLCRRCHKWSVRNSSDFMTWLEKNYGIASDLSETGLEETAPTE